MVWLFVITAVCADILTAGLFAVGCGVGENASEATQDFCDSIVSSIPLAGVPIAIAGAFISRSLRREGPWLGGVAIALLLAGLVWILAP